MSEIAGYTEAFLDGILILIIVSVIGINIAYIVEHWKDLFGK